MPTRWTLGKTPTIICYVWSWTLKAISSIYKITEITTFTTRETSCTCWIGPWTRWTSIPTIILIQDFINISRIIASKAFTCITTKTCSTRWFTLLTNSFNTSKSSWTYIYTFRIIEIWSWTILVTLSARVSCSCASQTRRWTICTACICCCV